jgi:hypothetical protein
MPTVPPARTVTGMTGTPASPEPVHVPPTTWQLLLRGAAAPFRAARAMSRPVIAVAVVAAVLVALEQFVLPGAGYGALGLLMAASMWFAHQEASRLRKEHPEVPAGWVYAGGAFVTFPFSYAVLVLLAVGTALGFLALIAWALLSVVKLAGGGSTMTVRRGASSHVNTDGSAKIEYANASLAEQAALKYEADFGAPMNAYRCARGNHFHIGHRGRVKP